MTYGSTTYGTGTYGAGESGDRVLYWAVQPSATTNWPDNATGAGYIAAGQDGTGSALSAGMFGSQPYEGPGQIDMATAASGLTPGQSYEFGYVVYDVALGTYSNVVVSAAWETLNEVAGALAATETGADTAAIAGQVVVAGSIAAAETGDDTAAISGSQTITGSLAATEVGDDAAAIAGAVLVAGLLAALETGADTALINGSSIIITSGSVAAIESGDDTAAVTGAVLVAGLLAAVETGTDSAGLAGQILVVGLVAATETGSDTASITAAEPLTSTPERTYRLPPELRVYVVPTESRTWKAKPS